MIKVISGSIIGGVVMLASEGRAQVLFDGAQGLPATQGWTFYATGGSQSLNNGAAQLDTSANNLYQGGYSMTAPTALNHTNGFTLAFTSEVISEAHASTNRAGFSVILLSDDKHGIELGFWGNTIFAQSDSPMFTHAEAASFATTTGFVNYALTLRATNYVLQANGTPILTGPIRDYESFGFPYTSPDFIFFGDDTTSAGGAFALSKVVLVTAPQVAADRSKKITWTGVAGQTYSILSSSNLVNWVTAQSVTAATTNFIYTNSSSVFPAYFRVSYP